MNLAAQIGRWVSLRAPQRESLGRLHALAEAVDFKRSSVDEVKEAAEARASVQSIAFDIEFASFCFALTTGAGKTRLMGACVIARQLLLRLLRSPSRGAV